MDFCKVVSGGHEGRRSNENIVFWRRNIVFWCRNAWCIEVFG